MCFRFETDAYVGDNALANREMLALNNPIERGIITNWDDMEKIWNHAFVNGLNAAPEEHPVFLTEPPLNPKANREKATQIMLETFQAPAVSLGFGAVLALHASGRTTGLSVDCGHGSIHCVPVYEGYSLPHATLRMDVGGNEVTEYLANRLGSNAFSYDIFTDMKENHCYVALDSEKKSQRNIQHRYELPDGQSIEMGAETFQAPEVLFQPVAMIGLGIPGMHEHAYNAIFKCDLDVRRDLYGNVVLVCIALFFAFLYFLSPFSLEKGTSAKIKAFFILLTGPFSLSFLVWRHFNVAWYNGATTPRNQLSRPINYESECYSSPRAKILDLDWRLGASITLYIRGALRN